MVHSSYLQCWCWADEALRTHSAQFDFIDLLLLLRGCVFAICCGGYSVAKSYPTLCDPMDCSVPGSTISWSLLKFMSVELVMLCHLLFYKISFLPSFQSCHIWFALLLWSLSPRMGWTFLIFTKLQVFPSSLITLLWVDHDSFPL